MNREVWTTVICAVFLIAAGACLKHRSASQVIVEIRSGLIGNFLLELGVKEAPALVTQGDAYAVTAPRKRKRITSTLLNEFTADIPEFQRGRSVGLFAIPVYHRRRHSGWRQDRIFRGNQKRVRSRTGQEEAWGRHFNSRGIDRRRHLP